MKCFGREKEIDKHREGGGLKFFWGGGALAVMMECAFSYFLKVEEGGVPLVEGGETRRKDRYWGGAGEELRVEGSGVLSENCEQEKNGCLPFPGWQKSSLAEFCFLRSRGTVVDRGRVRSGETFSSQGGENAKRGERHHCGNGGRWVQCGES